MELLQRLRAMGVARVVLGTKAIEDEVFLKDALQLFGESVIVSLDTRGDTLMVKGWQEAYTAQGVLEYIAILKNAGIRQVVYTDVSKDGMLTGPNITGLQNMLRISGLQVIASGGISCLDDIRKVAALEKDGLSGIIIGKALYEGNFTLRQAAQQMRAA